MSILRCQRISQIVERTGAGGNYPRRPRWGSDQRFRTYIVTVISLAIALRGARNTSEVTDVRTGWTGETSERMLSQECTGSLYGILSSGYICHAHPYPIVSSSIIPLLTTPSRPTTHSLTSQSNYHYIYTLTDQPPLRLYTQKHLRQSRWPLQLSSDLHTPLWPFHSTLQHPPPLSHPPFPHSPVVSSHPLLPPRLPTKPKPSPNLTL